MAIIKEKNFKIRSVIENLDSSGLAEGDAETSEICTDGFFKIDEERYTITYSEESQGGKIVSDIVIDGTAITVRRAGAIKSELYFREGEKHSSLYEIPPYSFDTTVITKKIRNNLTRDGGTLDIFYNMNIGGQDKKVRMKITVGEPKNPI